MRWRAMIPPGYAMTDGDESKGGVEPKEDGAAGGQERQGTGTGLATTSPGRTVAPDRHAVQASAALVGERSASAAVLTMLRASMQEYLDQRDRLGEDLDEERTRREAAEKRVAVLEERANAAKDGQLVAIVGSAVLGGGVGAVLNALPKISGVGVFLCFVGVIIAGLGLRQGRRP